MLFQVIVEGLMGIFFLILRSRPIVGWVTQICPVQEDGEGNFLM